MNAFVSQRIARQLVLAVCFAFAGSALISTARGESLVWRRVRSENFVVVSNASEADARRAAARLEELRAVFSRLQTRGGFDVSIPVIVLLFQNDSDYEFFKPSYGGDLRHDASGYFQFSPDVNYITFTLGIPRGRDPFAVLSHEYVHALVRNNYAGAPLWFNEGLAQYYSASELSPDRKRINFGQRLDSRLDALTRPNELLPLQTLLSVDAASPHYHQPEKSALFYAESWVLVHYLLNDATGARQAQLARYLELAAAAGGTTSIEENFRRAFKVDFGHMESDLRAYVRAARYASQSEPFNEAVPLELKAESRALTAAETQAALGDLLLHTGRPDDAEEYLERALKWDAKLAAAHSSLGHLRLKQGRLGEAREHLQLAIEGDPNNHLAHFYYADLLRREGFESEKTVTGYAATTRLIRTELKRVLELAPGFLEAYALLGLVDLERSPQVDETFTLLSHAATLAPKRPEFKLLLAQLHLRREEFDRARQALAPLARDSRLSAQARAEAQALLEKVAAGEAEFAAQRKAQSYAPGGGESNVETNAAGTNNASGAARAGAAETIPPAETQPCDMPQPGPQFKKLRFDGWQACGQLVSVECEDAGGVTLLVEMSDGNTLTLHSAALNRIRFVTYTADVRGRIECGLRTRANPVLVTYRLPKYPRAAADGEVLAVEFVPPDWVH